MAGSPPTACPNSRYGCGGTYFPELGQRYCSTCQQAMDKEKAAAPPQSAELRWPVNKPKGKERSEHDRLMQTNQWRNRTSPTMKACNPICQHLEDGKQCTAPAKEIHHLDDDPKLFFTPSNLVAVCAMHHPKSQGQPDVPREYSPTIWIGGAVFPHQPERPPGTKLLFYSMGKPVFG